MKLSIQHLTKGTIVAQRPTDIVIHSQDVRRIKLTSKALEVRAGLLTKGSSTGLPKALAKSEPIPPLDFLNRKVAMAAPLALKEYRVVL